MFGFQGTKPDDLPADLVAIAGAVILFRRNIQSAQQVRVLTDAIRAIPRADGVAPLIAVDEEGGAVSRLAGVGTTTPAAMALGAAADPRLTEAMYRLVGDELAALGVSVNLAPVADINDNQRNPVIGTRSFGDEPVAVSSHVRAAIRGLRSAGVSATAKHFPGHGDTVIDSHLDLPTIAASLTQLRMSALVPFVAAIAERVDLIMSAHVLYPALERGGVPATLSPATLSGLLRDELHFNGIISTDCLEMRAIADRFSPAESATKAVAAGADLVLFSHTPDSARAAVDALAAALRNGTLSETRVGESLQRVRSLRSRLAEAAGGKGRSSLESVGSQMHQDAALEAARRAVTFIRDQKGNIPLVLGSGDKVLVVQFTGVGASAVEDPHATVPAHRDGSQGPARVRYTTTIGRLLGSGPARVHEQVRSLDPAGHEYKQLLMAAGTANAVVAVTSRASAHPMQARAVADLALLGKRVIAVAAREPYDADVLPPEVSVLASFGEDAHALYAAAEVILGTRVARGTLPVRLKGSASQPA